MILLVVTREARGSSGWQPIVLVYTEVYLPVNESGRDEIWRKSIYILGTKFTHSYFFTKQNLPLNVWKPMYWLFHDFVHWTACSPFTHLISHNLRYCGHRSRSRCNNQPCLVTVISIQNHFVIVICELADIVGKFVFAVLRCCLVDLRKYHWNNILQYSTRQ